MRNSVTLKRKRRKIVRVFFDPFSSRIAIFIHRNFTVKKKPQYSTEFCIAFKEHST